MPRYCFTNRAGETVERVFALGAAPRFIYLARGGKRAKFKRNVVAEHRHTRDVSGTWPMKSDAAGVAPSQVQEAREHSVKIGIPTDFTPDGRAIFHSRLHRKQYCEAIGLYDRNGGYSDPQRRS